jgi:hypothetical protein
VPSVKKLLREDIWNPVRRGKKSTFDPGPVQGSEQKSKNVTTLLFFPECTGLPHTLTSNIVKLYKDCKVKIKIGKCKLLINYTTGVHQGDNMSPVLFLFVMQAFLDTLEIKAQPIKFANFPENRNGKIFT